VRVLPGATFVFKVKKMCMHNEEDYTCPNCCYQYGYNDAYYNEGYDNEYKNFEQVDSYNDGYKQGLLDAQEEENNPEAQH